MTEKEFKRMFKRQRRVAEQRRQYAFVVGVFCDQGDKYTVTTQAAGVRDGSREPSFMTDVVLFGKNRGEVVRHQGGGVTNSFAQAEENHMLAIAKIRLLGEGFFDHYASASPAFSHSASPAFSH